MKDILSELALPHKTLKLLLIFLDNYILDNTPVVDEGKNKTQNILALTHAISLVADEIGTIRQKYIVRNKAQA